MPLKKPYFQHFRLHGDTRKLKIKILLVLKISTHKKGAGQSLMTISLAECRERYVSAPSRQKHYFLIYLFIYRQHHLYKEHYLNERIGGY